jgi:DNA primase
MIAEEKILEIRERLDIVAVVSSYLPLKRSGANHQGLCPFHGEKTPSFNVNATRQIFHCFGCGVGGNVFSFVMRMEGLSFPETVRRLGAQAGVVIEEDAPSPDELRRRETAEQLLKVNEAACEFYHRYLLEDAEGEVARRYLRGRGYGQETARRFRLGYAPAQWQSLGEHLAKRGFDPRWARELGLVKAGRNDGEFDFFRARLLFPITDIGGRVVAFGGRVLDDTLPKYLNSPESPVYHKGQLLYGLHQARDAMRQNDEGIVVEGYFDQLALFRAGFPNVVATCGTALTVEHVRLLKRYCSRLLLLFDQDGAGRKATFRAMDALLAEGLSAAVVQLDAGEDPDSFLRTHGAEIFRSRLRAAKPLLEVYMDDVLATVNDIEGKARGAATIMAKLRLLPGEIERNLYVQELARRTGVDAVVLQGQARSAPPPAAAAKPAAAARPSAGRERLLPVAPGAGRKAQQWLLALMTKDHCWRVRVAQVGVDSVFLDDHFRAVATVLTAVADQQQLDESSLFDRLDDEQKGILSGILIKDDELFAEDPERIFVDCRRAVSHEQLRRRRTELNELVNQAEAAGDESGRARLLQELMNLKKALGSR